MPVLNKRMCIIVLLTMVLTFFTYFTHALSETRNLDHFDVIFQRLYFIPMILGGLWFAFRGGVIVSSVIVVSLLPHLYLHWEGFGVGDLNRILQLGAYLVVSIVLGQVVEMQHREEKRAQEAETLAAVGKSMSAIAHDMKTPLIAIGGFTNIVRRNLPNDSPDREKLNIVLAETARLENLVKGVLDFARPLELNRSGVSIEQVVKECIAVTGQVAEGSGIRVQSRFGSNLPNISIDEFRMKQALINLMTNAIQASPSGGCVIVSAEMRKRDLIIDVTDCGDGIPIEKREEIFSPFFTTKKEGVGLGLPIVKKVVEAHEGNLRIIDNPRGGLTFRIVLPGVRKHAVVDGLSHAPRLSA